MAEQDLIRFLDKVAQLQQLVSGLERDPERRDRLAACSCHNEVVDLARVWGYEIGRRWGEPRASARRGDNLLESALPPAGEERVQVLQRGNGWRLLLIASNAFQSSEAVWLDQPDHEWVMVLRGSARLRLQEPDATLDLSAGDHLHLTPHRLHRVERTDPDPGTLWLALHWNGCVPEETIV